MEESLCVKHVVILRLPEVHTRQPNLVPALLLMLMLRNQKLLANLVFPDKPHQGLVEKDQGNLKEIRKNGQQLCVVSSQLKINQKGK
jgi:hypothetical protein